MEDIFHEPEQPMAGEAQPAEDEEEKKMELEEKTDHIEGLDFQEMPTQETTGLAVEESFKTPSRKDMDVVQIPNITAAWGIR